MVRRPTIPDMVRQLARVLLWLVFACALAVLLLFLRALASAMLAVARGGTAHVWLFDGTRYVPAAAGAVLAVALSLFLLRRMCKRRSVQAPR